MTTRTESNCLPFLRRALSSYFLHILSTADAEPSIFPVRHLMRYNLLDNQHWIISPAELSAYR